MKKPITSWDFETIKASLKEEVGIDDMSREKGLLKITYQNYNYYWNVTCPNDGDEAGWRKLLTRVSLSLLAKRTLR